MSQSAFLGPLAARLPKEANGKEGMREVKISRFCCAEESLCGLSWLVGIAGLFLLIGGVGIARFEPEFEVTLSGRAGLGAVDNDSTDMSMAELLAMEEVTEVNPVQEEVQEVPTEVVELVEMTLEMQEQLELPELTEALVSEDVFAVPAAPKIEVALTPVDPAKPKPKPKPQPRNNTPPRPRGGPATSPVAAVGGTTGSGGGGGGNGTVGAGGKGRFPKPTYPSGARSRGVSGSLTFRIRISPSGSVEGAEVISSNCSNGGFTASEQNQISAFIRRNWRFPQGMMGTRNLPIRFDLR